jgi:hypothetical protein
LCFYDSGPKGQIKEDQMQDAMEIGSLNKNVEPEERKMKLETANLSLVSATLRQLKTYA